MTSVPALKQTMERVVRSMTFPKSAGPTNAEGVGGVSPPPIIPSTPIEQWGSEEIAMHVRNRK